ncbi:MAG: hypothetical protein AUI14_06040 [Actinobacteria bacterium 13_2_20CM_2_71_6]|nr:MAG: hypothetical protein AUI14_06040 [Actinobacteria bacterium 13_2_20CM_2_71_6]
MIAWEFGSLAFFGAMAVRTFDLRPAGIAILAAGLAALWLVGSWQILRMGVHVGPAGIRICSAPVPCHGPRSP